nr:hypothetical protein [Marinicella sp. W31]MDC2876707.1 hypothetical protein [Marinicella sp. W31]
MEALVTHLSQSHQMLASVVDQAAARLSSADEQLNTTANRINETAQRSSASLADSSKLLGSKVDALDDSAATALETVHGLVSQIESHASVLDRASNLIESAQSNLANTLSERQQALGLLSDGLAERSQEIDKGLKAVAAAVAASMDKTGREAQTMSENVAETMRGTVEDAAKRFSGATQEIERISAEIRTELDQTREAVKRGIHDMPEEARESAQAMRKAVEDQIRALQDISSMISTSRSQISAPQTPRSTAAKTEEPKERPLASPPAGSLGMATPDLRSTMPREPRQQAVTRTTAGSAPGGEGWISDLLRAAAREEAGQRDQPKGGSRTSQVTASDRKPNQVVDSLNSLSVDIARAIDHDASVELWHRYQQGERDVFTRRLYTLKGQRTFDEIKAKYDGDREFRTSVDRYIGDFEKLLSDVMRKNRDRAAVQSYLTSDTGKVYTMLAHAAGRLK